MKRTFAVTILVDVEADSEKGLARVARELRLYPPSKAQGGYDRDDGSYRVASRSRARSVVLMPQRAGLRVLHEKPEGSRGRR